MMHPNPTLLPRHVTIAADVLCQHVEGQAVLLNLGPERYHSLDDVGTRMWDLLTVDGDVETMIGTLLDEYDVDETQLRHDVAALLQSLKDAQLIIVE
ncbi:MAG: PqqD family protein [Gemmatimonas sp.]